MLRKTLCIFFLVPMTTIIIGIPIIGPDPNRLLQTKSTKQIENELRQDENELIQAINPGLVESRDTEESETRKNTRFQHDDDPEDDGVYNADSEDEVEEEDDDDDDEDDIEEYVRKNKYKPGPDMHDPHAHAGGEHGHREGKKRANGAAAAPGIQSMDVHSHKDGDHSRDKPPEPSNQQIAKELRRQLLKIDKNDFIRFMRYILEDQEIQERATGILEENSKGFTDVILDSLEQKTLIGFAKIKQQILELFMLKDVHDEN